MGPRFRNKHIEAYVRLVRDYPLSPLVEEAKKRLAALEVDIPEPDPVALARMKYELEHMEKPGLLSHFWGIFRKSPDVRMAAKSGTPTMEPYRPQVPASVPAAATGTTGVTAEVTVAPVTDTSALDTKPDARRQPLGSAKPESQQSAPSPTPAPKP